MLRYLLLFLCTPCFALMTSHREILVDSAKHPVVLGYNPDAVDPSWVQLYAFLQQSTANRHTYVAGQYVCTEFAMQLQQEATAAGWRAGLVHIGFGHPPEHMAVVFHTNLGDVYADYTGDAAGPDNADHFHTIGYLIQGRVYGRLPLEVARENPVDYAFFVQVQEIWQRLPQYLRQLQAERRQLQQDQAVLEESRKSMDRTNKSDVNAFNAQVAVINQRVDVMRQHAQKYNAFVAYLKISYSINPNPVQMFETWWPAPQG